MPVNLGGFSFQPQNDPTLDDLLEQLGIGTGRAASTGPTPAPSPSLDDVLGQLGIRTAPQPQGLSFGPSPAPTEAAQRFLAGPDPNLPPPIPGGAGTAGGYTPPAPTPGEGTTPAPGQSARGFGFGADSALSFPKITPEFMNSLRFAGSGSTAAGSDDGSGSSSTAATSPSPGPSATSIPSPPPSVLYGKRGVLGDVLDNIFLGGAIQAHRDTERQHAFANYELQRDAGILQTLTPSQQIAFLTNRPELGKALAERSAPHVLSGGQSLDEGEGGGPMQTAPLMGQDNGRLYTQTPGASTITGFTGPQVGANGIDARTGRQFQVASTPVVAAGSNPWNVVTPGNAFAQPPQVGGSGLDGLGLPSAPTAPATTAASIQALAAGVPPGSGSGPRGLRNNNPGNLRPLSRGQWAGQTGVDPGNYAQFGSQADGIAAADKNLLAKQTRHGLNTVAGIIAAPGVGWDPGNMSYARTVAKSLGVGPNDPVDLTDPNVRQKMLGAIFTVENGRQMSAVGLPAAVSANFGSGAAQIQALANGASSAPSAKGFSGGSATPLGQPRVPHLLSADDPRLKMFPPGSVVEEDATGHVAAQPNTGYTPEVVAGMRHEVFNNPDYKKWAETVPLVRSARTAFADNSANADLNLVEAAGRIYNPNAIVRPGMVKAFQETQGIPDIITGALAQLNTGKANARLTPDTRSALMAQVESRAAETRRALQPTLDSYGSLADRKGIDRADILPPVDEIGPPPRAAGPVVTLNPQNPNADFARLQRGQQYRGPDGVVRTK